MSKIIQMPTLVAVEGPFKGQTFQLSETSVLGRSSKANLHLDDPAVSRFHARIFLRAGRFFIEDLDSENGTMVNGREILAVTPLENGDRVGLPGSVFRFAGKSVSGVGNRVTIDKEPWAAPPVLETLDVTAVSLERPVGQRDTVPNTLIKAEQRLHAVLEISNAIRTQLEIDRLLNQILERLFGVFRQADRGFIILKDNDSDVLMPRATRHRDPEQPEAAPISRSIVEKAMADRVAIRSADAMGDQRFAAASSVKKFEIRSMICVPIISEGEALGVIHLDTARQDRHFTHDDLELLTGVTNQVAFAIANARLHGKLLVQERTERELEIARQMQKAFLPRDLPEVAGIQFGASYKAALAVSGDFYDFIRLEADKLAVVVGDVAGKGIPAALMMARMSSAIREFALIEGDPRRVVARANERLSAMGVEGSFITLIYVLLDLRSRTLQMVNAGHPPPLLRKGSASRVSEIQSCINYPVGVVLGWEFETESFQMETGDFVCLYSDGITEAMNVQKQSYGAERLKSAMALPVTSAAQLTENILQDVNAFVGSAHPSDDLTLVCFGAI
jgi:serine phosphatase RsbU (regulator of sigma subunit)